jgi:hypothetical protein
MAIRFVFTNGTNIPLIWNVAASGIGWVASGVASGMSNASGTLSSGRAYTAQFAPLVRGDGPVPVLRSAQFTGDTEITFSITATPL